MVIFYTFFTVEKVNGFSMCMKKISSGLVVIGILKENQLKDKYVISKMGKVYRKEGYCDIFIK